MFWCWFLQCGWKNSHAYANNVDTMASNVECSERHAGHTIEGLKHNWHGADRWVKAMQAILCSIISILLHVHVFIDVLKAIHSCEKYTDSMACMTF